MNIKAAAVFKSIKLQTEEMVVFMVLNDHTLSVADIVCSQLLQEAENN
jgi:hypothetical protein